MRKFVLNKEDDEIDVSIEVDIGLGNLVVKNEQKEEGRFIVSGSMVKPVKQFFKENILRYAEPDEVEDLEAQLDNYVRYYIWDFLGLKRIPVTAEKTEEGYDLTDSIQEDIEFELVNRMEAE